MLFLYFHLDTANCMNGSFIIRVRLHSLYNSYISTFQSLSTRSQQFLVIRKQFYSIVGLYFLCTILIVHYNPFSYTVYPTPAIVSCLCCFPCPVMSVSCEEDRQTTSSVGGFGEGRHRLTNLLYTSLQISSYICLIYKLVNLLICLQNIWIADYGNNFGKCKGLFLTQQFIILLNSLLNSFQIFL